MNTGILYVIAAAFPLMAPTWPAIGVLLCLIHLAKRIEKDPRYIALRKR